MYQFISKIVNTLSGLVSFKKINPHLHWKNLIYLFFVIMVILILFSFFLLYQIKNQQIFQTVTSTVAAPNLVNEKLLKEVTKSFDVKQAKQKNVEQGSYIYKDPSIN